MCASWSAPANNGGPITGYGVEYREGTEGDWEVHEYIGTGTTATIYRPAKRPTLPGAGPRYKCAGSGLVVAGRIGDPLRHHGRAN